MWVTALASTALLLFTEITTAKAIHYKPRGTKWRRSLDDDMRKAAFDILDGQLDRRQTTASSITPTTSTISDMNATIVMACTSGLSGVSSVSNQAGIAACYNILQHDLSQGAFQADLRLYLADQPTGSFADIQPSNMMIGVTYPPSTTFESLMKRSLRTPVARQSSSMTEMQQYSLMGHIDPSLDLSKLNATELMSLMVPQISINAVSSTTANPISTNVSTTDMVYFVTGDFVGQFSTSLMTPQMQALAMSASSKFVLPGTTFGIFPTGGIVTTVWTVLFVVSYGVGTFGRLRHRNVYRARKAAVGARVGRRL